ncbi:MAG: TonB-dependent receptor, partial [Novosphingobium sp.]|nr:TonB-dependent receptor [Novosphingobium sp.]
QTYAAFADLTYEISPQLFLTGGLRYSHDTTTDAFYIPPFTGNTVSVPDLKGDKFTPRVVLRYKPDENSSVYASYSKGYKAGVIDVGGNSANRVSPEDINAFELGYKYANRRFSLDLSGYYYDYRDLQVSLFVVNQGVASARLVNAARSRIYGLEGQTRYAVSDNFDLTAGAAWTHARYRQFDNAPVYTRCTVSSVPCSPGQSFAVVPTTLRDVQMQRTPAFTANLGGRYTTPLAGGSLALSGNLYYNSKFFFGPSGTQFPQTGYEVLGLRAEWTDASEKLSLAVYGDNVTNQRYRTQVQYNNFGVGSVWNYPVSYGVQVGVKY